MSDVNKQALAAMGLGLRRKEEEGNKRAMSRRKRASENKQARRRQGGEAGARIDQEQQEVQ